MSTTTPNWIDRLSLRTIDPDRTAHVAVASVPLPPPGAGHALVTWQGLRAQAVPLAWYSGADGPGLPRQLLLLGLGATPVADQLGLAPAPAGAVVDVRTPQAARASAAGWAGPRWDTVILEEKKTGITMREVNELALEHGGRRLGIRMGIELNDGSHHWWEWLQIEQLWSGPVGTAIRAAGYVPIAVLGEEETINPARYNSGYWLHRHNWLFAEVYAQVFVNGLIRVTTRHVNNRFFDQGRDLEGFVPVIGFHTADAVSLAPTPLDGRRTDFDLGPVHLDIERSTDIISPEHPGQLRRAGDLVVYQPYEGAEFLLGDGEPADRWKVQAHERRLWKGMARSVGFDLSFAAAPIRTRRYLPPYGWQAHAGALWPDRTLPARGPLESTIDRVIDLKPFKQETSTVKPFCSGRYFQASCMWDGEHAHGWMVNAYRTGRRDCYDAALHHAYAFADVGIDHADFTHQICDMPKGSISLVLQRNLGMLAAYLETGDPYLLRCAETMADVAYGIDRSNWPRHSYGRDGAYIRSLTRLYDVTGQRFYLERAGDACRRAAQCQRPNGSFGDQGATTGAHGHLGEITKPWMSSILAEVFADYLERAGHDPVVEAALLRTADWLLTAQLEDKDGRYWPYQMAWGQNEFDPTSKWRPGQPPVRHPTGAMQLDYNARTLLLVSLRTGDPKYARAWQATYERFYVKLGRLDSVYGAVKVPDNFPWHEAHLWGARWDGAQLTFAPRLDLIAPGREALIELPDGQTVRVRRTDQGVEQVR